MMKKITFLLLLYVSLILIGIKINIIYLKRLFQVSVFNCLFLHYGQNCFIAPLFSKSSHHFATIC